MPTETPPHAKVTMLRRNTDRPRTNLVMTVAPQKLIGPDGSIVTHEARRHHQEVDDDAENHRISRGSLYDP